MLSSLSRTVLSRMHHSSARHCLWPAATVVVFEPATTDDAQQKCMAEKCKGNSTSKIIGQALREHSPFSRLASSKYSTDFFFSRQAFARKIVQDLTHANNRRRKFLSFLIILVHPRSLLSRGPGPLAPVRGGWYRHLLRHLFREHRGPVRHLRLWGFDQPPLGGHRRHRAREFRPRSPTHTQIGVSSGRRLMVLGQRSK